MVLHQQQETVVKLVEFMLLALRGGVTAEEGLGSVGAGSLGGFSYCSSWQ